MSNTTEKAISPNGELQESFNANIHSDLTRRYFDELAQHVAVYARVPCRSAGLEEIFTGCEEKPSPRLISYASSMVSPWQDYGIDGYVQEFLATVAERNPDVTIISRTIDLGQVEGESRYIGDVERAIENCFALDKNSNEIYVIRVKNVEPDTTNSWKRRDSISALFRCIDIALCNPERYILLVTTTDEITLPVANALASRLVQLPTNREIDPICRDIYLIQKNINDCMKMYEEMMEKWGCCFRGILRPLGQLLPQSEDTFQQKLEVDPEIAEIEREIKNLELTR